MPHYILTLKDPIDIYLYKEEVADGNFKNNRTPKTFSYIFVAVLRADELER